MLNDSSVNKLNDNVTMSMQPVGYFVYNKNSTILVTSLQFNPFNYDADVSMFHLM